MAVPPTLWIAATTLLYPGLGRLAKPGPFEAHHSTDMLSPDHPSAVLTDHIGSHRITISLLVPGRAVCPRRPSAFTVLLGAFNRRAGMGQGHSLSSTMATMAERLLGPAEWHAWDSSRCPTYNACPLSWTPPGPFKFCRLSYLNVRN